MWKNYSKSYLANNKNQAFHIMTACLISTFFLSMICSLSYNHMAYEVQNNVAADVSGIATPLTILFTILLVTACLSLILIIKNSFELSMNSRIHQFGILGSIGATPKQIKVCLLQEVLILCIIPVVIGTLLGVFFCFGVVEFTNVFSADIQGRQPAVFQYHIGVALLTILTALLTVFLSALLPARKLSKISLLTAIRIGNVLQLKKSKKSPMLSLLFGIEGELAGNSLKAQRKSLRLANFSLLFSFLGFCVMLCLTTFSSISTQHTYFERYQNDWDIMITVKNTDVASVDLKEDLQKFPNIEDVAIYQILDNTAVFTTDDQSKELQNIGGFNAISGKTDSGDVLNINAPVVIMDDESFLDYCSYIGTEPKLDSAILLNRIWDNTNSNFRYKEYIPFICADIKETKLIGNEIRDINIPVLAHTDKTPQLREEYANYSLIHFIPLSLWNDISSNYINSAIGADSFIRILSSDKTDLTRLNNLETSVSEIVSQKYEIESENRLQEKVSNDKMILGLQVIFSMFCVLLAVIGLSNVFLNTFGFIQSRQREFAQYMSFGLTPQQMKKMFFVEGVVIAGKPLFVTMIITLMFVQFAATASYLNPAEFWQSAPVIPIIIFAFSIIGFVALAYYIGAKRLMNTDLTEVLKNDSLV